MTDEATNEAQENTEEQARKDFLAGFNGEDTEVEQAAREQEEQEQVEQEQEAQQQEQETPEPEQEAEPEEDLYAGIPADVIQRIKQETREDVEKEFSGRLRNLEGHIGGLNRHYKELAAAQQAAASQGVETPTDRQIADAAKSGTKLNALKEDFPEFAEALEEALSGFAPQQGADMTPAMQEMAKMRQEAFIERQKAKLDRAFPEWESDIQTDRFQNWLFNQTPEIQALAESQVAEDAIKALTQYHAEIAPQQAGDSRQAQSRRLADAVQPTSGNEPTRRAAKTSHELFLEGFYGPQG